MDTICYKSSAVARNSNTHYIQILGYFLYKDIFKMAANMASFIYAVT